MRLELLDFRQQLSPLLIERDHFGNLRFVSTVARREPLADEISVLPYQPDIKHRGSIGMEFSEASAGQHQREFDSQSAVL